MAYHLLLVFDSFIISFFQRKKKKTAVNMKIPDTFFSLPIWEIDFPSLYKKREALKTAIPTSGSLKFKSNDLFFPLRLHQVGFRALLEWIKMFYLVEEFLRMNVLKNFVFAVSEVGSIQKYLWEILCLKH